MTLRVEVTDWQKARREAAAIREAVFVHEQGVPPELEYDEHDPLCLHALAYDGNVAVATGRLLPDGHIGRMAVAAKYRGRGAGRQVLEALIQASRERGDQQVILAAQAHAIGFYERSGFVAHGGIFLEAGIEHRWMTLSLNTPEST